MFLFYHLILTVYTMFSVICRTCMYLSVVYHWLKLLSVSLSVCPSVKKGRERWESRWCRRCCTVIHVDGLQQKWRQRNMWCG